MQKWVIFTAGSLLLAGCIHHEETVYKDVKRVRVEFENDHAARLFYETYEHSSHRHSGEESKTEVKVPFVFSDERKVVSGPNAAFNKAVDQCDTDGDGRITVREAESYADRRR